MTKRTNSLPDGAAGYPFQVTPPHEDMRMNISHGRLAVFSHRPSVCSSIAIENRMNSPSIYTIRKCPNTQSVRSRILPVFHACLALSV